MVEIFNGDGARRLPKLCDAVASEDAKVVKEEAHALEGGTETFFDEPAFQTAYELEKMGVQGDLTGAAATLSALEVKLQQLRQKPDELLKSPSRCFRRLKTKDP